MQTKRLSLYFVTFLFTLGCCVGICVASPNQKAAKKHKSGAWPYSPPTIAKLLHWTASSKTNNKSGNKSILACNLCGGYYQQPATVLDHPQPKAPEQEITHIHASGRSTFRDDGVSILRKNVRVKQPGRLVTADKAKVKRHQGQITGIHLIGNAHLWEYNKLLASPDINIDFLTHTTTMQRVAYHLFRPLHHPHTDLAADRAGDDAYGIAEHVKRNNKSDKLVLKNATYSTCNPLDPTWHISADSITIDEQHNKASAKGMVMWLKGVPIFYLPYFTFTLKHHRKSGFLFPGFSHSDDSGYIIDLPFYWNMAPNYDLTITPYWMSERGFQIRTLFRYLSKSSHGLIHLSFLPDDREFNRFRKKPRPQTATSIPYINELNGFDNNRFYAAASNHSQWGPHWKSDVIINYTSDPYYFKDFSDDYASVTNNQLLNEISLQYTGWHWQLFGMLQAYQTLHLIDQISSNTVNQYQRLPDIGIAAEYPNIYHQLSFSINAEAVNFLYDSDDFAPFTYQRPEGQRLHIQPSLRYPMRWSEGYLTPEIMLDNTDYWAKTAVSSAGVHRPHMSASRNLPILDIDSGLYLDRHVQFGDSDYIASIEPRVFYLYVPYENQNKYPNFDTQLLPFSTDQLFARNRFSGFDRVANANQVTLAMSADLTNSVTGQRKLHATVGLIYYFTQSKVCLTTGCQTPDRDISPIVGKLTYYPFAHWSVTGKMAWDTHLNTVNNAEANLKYHLDDHRIISLGYTYVHRVQEAGGIPISAFGGTSTNVLHLGMTWPLNDHWSVLGYWYYNIREDLPENYFVGVEYDTCCLALRGIVERTYTGNNLQGDHQFKTTYMVQFLLKGLSSYGGDAEDLLSKID